MEGEAVARNIPHISDDPATFKVYRSAGGVLACTDASSEVTDGMVGCSYMCRYAVAEACSAPLIGFRRPYRLLAVCVVRQDVIDGGL
jgi:hypothetical protein